MINLQELGNLHVLEPLDLALHWASRGVPVLPTNPQTKAPWIGKEWERKASIDPEVIRGWAFRWDAGARVGIKTGLACGCGCLDGPDVLDFDISDGKPGLDQRQTLVLANVLDATQALRLGTPSGGEHWWFLGTDQHNKQNDDAVWGIDFRAHHGMVLAPGNPGYEIKSVPWDGLGKLDWHAVELCPGLRVKPGVDRPVPVAPKRAPVSGSLPRASKLVAPQRFDNAPGEESPMDWYSRTHDFGVLLVDDGWRFAYTHEARDYYVRPGKEIQEGVSGNVMLNADGRQTFINFSTTVDLPTDRGMSAAQWYAHRHHGGRFGDAARAIRQTMMPRHETAPAMAPVALVATQPGPVGTDAPPGAPVSPVGPPGRELVPIAEVGEPKPVRDFWQQREVLAKIRWFARERRVAPWAVLGAVLAQASCRIGPHVVLPAIVGGVASLNLLVGLVGPSGKGKGAATAVASEFLGVEGKFMSEEVGTSQGIDSSFSESVPKLGTVQFNDVAFFYVPEIDTVKAHAEMSGSALLPTLRKIWSGEPLGAKYAAKERRRQVRAHAYRAAVVAGIQPKRSGVLLDDVDGGTPQRWLWMPVTDPTAPRRTDKLKAPVYTGTPPRLEWDVWLPCGERRGDKDEPEQVEVKTRYVIPVCQKAIDAIIDAREINLTTEAANLDSHSLLTRLKVAALLAFLDERLEVLETDWDLALSVMWISNASRAECQRALAEAEEEEHAKRGRGRAMTSIAEQVATPVLKNRRVERIQELGGKALGILQQEPGREWSPRELKIATMDAKGVREYGDDVLAAVVATLGVMEGPEISSGGRKIRKLSWRPVIGPA